MPQQRDPHLRLDRMWRRFPISLAPHSLGFLFAVLRRVPFAKVLGAEPGFIRPSARRVISRSIDAKR
jgi:hypothetical protein